MALFFVDQQNAYEIHICTMRTCFINSEINLKSSCKISFEKKTDFMLK